MTQPNAGEGLPPESPELEPCPWCGATPKLRQLNYSTAVECANDSCCACGPLAEHRDELKGGQWAAAERQAVESWNRVAGLRAQVGALTQQVEAMRIERAGLLMQADADARWAAKAERETEEFRSQLREAHRDRERLDWLEASMRTLHCSEENESDASGPDGREPLRWMVVPRSAERWQEAPTVRAAIDAASGPPEEKKP